MIPEVSPYNNWTGDGSTTQFDFDFYIEDATQLNVYLTDETGNQSKLIYNTDYSINEFKNPSGSYIVYPIAGSTHSTLSSSEVISLCLTLPIEQTSSYGTSSELDLKALEFSLDYITRICQIIQRELERAVKVKEGSDIDTDELTSNINAIANSIGDVENVSANMADINDLADDLDLDANSNIKKVAANISNVNAVANNETNINAVNANKTNIDAVAGNETNINTVAGISSDVTTVAGISAGVSAVALIDNDISDIADDLNDNSSKIKAVANNITNINKVANNTTNVDRVANAISDVTAVSEDLSNVGIVAGAVSNVNKVGNTIANVNIVAGAVTNVGKVADDISNVNLTGGSIRNVNVVGNSISNVNTVASVESDVSAVAENIQSVIAAGDNAAIALSSANLAKDWATKTTGTVDGNDYSAKYYALQARDESAVTFNQLQANLGYERKEVISDDRLYRDVHKLANSTFDLSKFTVVGTPTITADGIASNLSDANFIDAIPVSMYHNKSNWHLQFETYFTASTTTSSTLLGFIPWGHVKYHYDWNAIVLLLTDINSAEIFVTVEQIRSKIVEGNIVIDVYYSSSTGYYFTITQDEVVLTSSVSSNTNQLLNSDIWHLLYLANQDTISVDLKTIKFFVDDFLVFNGNKTGEDVISSGSSYTIFGTSTIVDSNNIASGFNQGSGIKYDINYAGNSYNTFELYLGEYELTTVNVGQWFYINTKTENSIQSGFMIQFNDQNKLRFFGGSGTANNDIFSGHIGSVTHAQNAKVKIKLVFDGSNYTLYSSDNGGAWVQEYTKATTLKILFPTEVILGQNQNYFRGKINLNDIKTIIDGSIKLTLIELSIPYILSSTGSKIVDSAYRDRVSYLYEQEGKALYYTIDYVNKNVTLPMGEIYGFIASGGTPFSTAMLSYPTGTSASSDSTLYNYIKGMYDNGTSMVDLNTYWTVEGSLTITDYGIASGFSSSNYVKLSEIDLTQANSWELEIGGVTPSDATNEGEILGFTDADWGQPGHDYILIGFYDDNGTPSLWVNTTNNNELIYPYPVSTQFKIKMEFTGTTYIFYIDTGSGYVEIYSNEDSTKIQSKFNNCILGNVKNDTTRAWNSTIDLSSFRLKINGKYIYYGYAIPCKAVSSGSRVVDVTNKALVDTFAQEIGFAPYYIIDTTNQTVTLPQGDIFGFISTLFFAK